MLFTLEFARSPALYLSLSLSLFYPFPPIAQCILHVHSRKSHANTQLMGLDVPRHVARNSRADFFVCVVCCVRLLRIRSARPELKGPEDTHFHLYIKTLHSASHTILKRNLIWFRKCTGIFALAPVCHSYLYFPYI